MNEKILDILAANATDIVAAYAETQNTIHHAPDDASFSKNVDFVADLIHQYDRLRRRLQRNGVQVKELDANPIDIFWLEG